MRVPPFDRGVLPAYDLGRKRSRSCAAAHGGRKGFAMRIQPPHGTTPVLVFMLAVWLAAPASAQVDTGTILGTVRDQSGGVLPGATVTITHEGQAFTLSTVTREDGTYVFTPIRIGAYSLEVEFTGFKKAVRRGITVN